VLALDLAWLTVSTADVSETVVHPCAAWLALRRPLIAQISFGTLATFTDSLPCSHGVSPRYDHVTRKACVMADILVLIGIIGFVAAMLAVIFGLGRADRRQLNYSGAVDRQSRRVNGSAQPPA
jgi:hypothetical protein